MSAADEALAAIREVDSEDQLGMVKAMPEHIRDAYWKLEMAQVAAIDAPVAVVCGMGGSAIGGDLARAALGDRLTRPLIGVRDYRLPAWVPSGAVVLCSSYSGQTEETLEAFESARKDAAAIMVATTGGALADAARAGGAPVVGLPSGLQPRAAVGYMLVMAAELARIGGGAPSLREELEAAGGSLEARFDALAERSAELAEQLEGSTVVIHGAGLTAPVAFRWKCQINENAKIPAFSSELPEADHNELVGWEGAPELGPYSHVYLADPEQHPRVALRIGLTAKLSSPGTKAAVTLEGAGATRSARLLELVVLGDLLSLQLAARRGIDPSPVPVIDRLKSELGDS